ncbi:hypothetical protein COV49_00725 [Candidatus Falkowbacteria bacterium CG11_big_fil_rev_8_21_14_0_20_39_10]|uniref:Uncharacterized protein n=1 Tax=Candidatus Falkowbacteria bacterium CG11_big_fil_rev_8_21_14_0_20_39_10 TaxID=1974570 RepID=A0A2M6KA46_9BACT|nr:MAG: hypothetical protein COV49_00725 [Candidatus Falkowbacteria bacterium CG11_big_fil_rev_8_21_14_0_20_39_10]
MAELLKFKAVITIDLLKRRQLVFGWPVDGAQLNKRASDCMFFRFCKETANLAGWESFGCIHDCTGFSDERSPEELTEDWLIINQILAGISGKENHKYIFYCPGVRVFNLIGHHHPRPDLRLVATG